jgi:AraC-like DNA-binding protein
MVQNPDFLSVRPDPGAAAGWTSDAADVLTTVMDALRLRSRVFCRSELAAPWGMTLRRSDYAHFHVVERGGAWLRVAGEAPLALAAGDLVVVPHGAGHALSDSPERATRPLAELAGDRASGGGCVVLRGEGSGPETHLVCGSFAFERPEAHPLLELLPPLVHLRPAGTPASEWLDATVRFLAWETREARPGTETIVSRLTDVLFVQVLRAWIETLPLRAGGWLGALRDRQIAAALGAIHRAPERPWTNESLAAHAGMSRSRFASRFADLVGEPPVGYLTRWRLERAAALLQEEGTLGVAEIAARVGYESETSFSKAFRRRFGTPPGAFRRAAA